MTNKGELRRSKLNDAILGQFLLFAHVRALREAATCSVLHAEPLVLLCSCGFIAYTASQLLCPEDFMVLLALHLCDNLSVF